MAISYTKYVIFNRKLYEKRKSIFGAADSRLMAPHYSLLSHLCFMRHNGLVSLFFVAVSRLVAPYVCL